MGAYASIAVTREEALELYFYAISEPIATDEFIDLYSNEFLEEYLEQFTKPALYNVVILHEDEVKDATWTASTLRNLISHN